MTQMSSLSNRFDGIRVEPIYRRRRIHHKSKISPQDADNHPSNVIDSKKRSDTFVSSSSPKMMNSVVENDDNTFSTTVTSFQQSRAAKRPETFLSTHDGSNALTNNYNNKDEQLKQANQSEKNDALWKCVLKILYGILGILFLTALIVPSILTYLLVPQSSQTASSELTTTYRNHCAGISPYSLWEINSTNTITMILNTSQCNFPDTPLYFASMAGLSNHFCLTGYDAIYLPTSESFQIYTQYICGTISSTLLLNMSQKYSYNVNWMGFYK